MYVGCVEYNSKRPLTVSVITEEFTKNSEITLTPPPALLVSLILSISSSLLSLSKQHLHKALSDPIDVYSEWIDAAESKPVPSVPPSRRRVPRPSAPGENAQVQFDEEDDLAEEEYDRDLGPVPGGRVISGMRDREEVGEEEEEDLDSLFGE